MSKTELVSPAEFARRMKVSQEMVRKAHSRGVFKGAIVQPPPGKKRIKLKYKLAVRYYNARLDPTFRKENQTPQKKSKGGNGAKPKTGGGKTIVEAKAEVEQYKAAELKLKHEINKGLWVKRDEVNDLAYRIARLARDNFLNIPARVSALMAAETSQTRCFGILHKEIKTVLDEMVEQLGQISKQKGAK